MSNNNIKNNATINANHKVGSISYEIERLTKNVQILSKHIIKNKKDYAALRKLHKMLAKKRKYVRHMLVIKKNV